MPRASRPCSITLVLVGACILTGALLHPWLPQAMDAQMRLIADARAWAPAHWLLTLGQAAAIPALALALVASGARDARALGAAAALGAGLMLGTLGTLVAATLLPELARHGDAALFGIVAGADLGLGWLCLLLTAAGALGLGLHAGAAAGTTLRRLGHAAALASGALLLTGLAIPYDHWWTHQFVLRAAAVALGGGAVAMGLLWPRMARSVDAVEAPPA